MISRKLDLFIENFYRTSSKALFLTGARQVGKSFAIRKFATANFPVYLELNFYKDLELRSLVQSAKTGKEILQRIALHTHTQLKEGETFIFFDEVQKCPEIITMIKFLVEDGRFRYGLSGSLLGIELKGKKVVESWPVGYIAESQVFPLDFEEFVLALGVGENIIDTLRDCWEHKWEIDSFVHQEMMKLFHLYLIVGGMPSPVQTYIDTEDFVQVEARQKEILDLYKLDIANYNPGRELQINEIFDLIPSELNAQNKRFIMKNMHETARYRQYANDFLWLKQAEMALPTYNVEAPVAPLKLNEKRNLFKLFQNDVGLLSCQYASGVQLKILQGETIINYGAIYENAVAEELYAHGWSLYYFNSKKQGELDFVLERDMEVIPLEVKSGKDYERHNALANVMQNEEYNLKQAIVLCNDNLKEDGKTLYAPIYMLMFIHQRPRQMQSVQRFVLPEFMKG